MQPTHGPMKVLIALFIFVFLASCAPKPVAVIDQATVVSKNSSLRLRNSSTSRTLVVLNAGDKVDVLERQDNWYRVRYGPDIQGWCSSCSKAKSPGRDDEPQGVRCNDGGHSEPPGRSRSKPLTRHAGKAGCLAHL